MASYLDDIDRIGKLMRDFADSPMQRVIRDLQASNRRRLELSSHQMMRAVEDLHRHATIAAAGSMSALARQPRGEAAALANLTRGLEETVGLSMSRIATASSAMSEFTLAEALRARAFAETLGSSMSRLASQYSAAGTARLVDTATRDLERMMARFKAPSLPPLPLFESYSGEIRRFSRVADAYENFAESFGGRLLSAITAFETAEPGQREEAAEALVQTVRHGAAGSEKSLISLEGWIQIVLAIFFFFLTVQDSGRLDRRLTTLQELQEQVARDLRGLHANRSEGLRVVEAARLNVRDKPGKDGARLAILTQGALVKLRAEKSGWALVEYFDFRIGATAEGWVFKRYLGVPEEMFNSE